jgi:hypothetical protein
MRREILLRIFCFDILCLDVPFFSTHLHGESTVEAPILILIPVPIPIRTTRQNNTPSPSKVHGQRSAIEDACAASYNGPWPVSEIEKLWPGVTLHS